MGLGGELNVTVTSFDVPSWTDPEISVVNLPLPLVGSVWLSIKSKVPLVLRSAFPFFMRKTQKIRRRVVLPQRRQVAVLIDFSRSYGRGLLSGVAKFVREHHEWSVQSEEWRWTDATPVWFKNWKGDGAIAWVETPELANIIRALGVPVVDVRGSVKDCGLPLIATENSTALSTCMALM